MAKGIPNSDLTPKNVADYLKEQIGTRGTVQAFFSSQFFKHFQSDECLAYIRAFQAEVENQEQEEVNSRIQWLKERGYKVSVEKK